MADCYTPIKDSGFAILVVGAAVRVCMVPPHLEMALVGQRQSRAKQSRAQQDSWSRVGLAKKEYEQT